MKKLALALVAATLLGLPTAPALASEEVGETSACNGLHHEWGYGTDDISYQVEIDLSGCDWWDGSPIRLDATLARLDAEGETIADTVTLCGVGPRVADEADRYRSTTCEVGVALEHPSVEVARYQGEITFPWRDGPRTVSFTVVCSAPALRCHDA